MFVFLGVLYYVTLYGGINSKLYDENSSFISDIDNKKRYNLKDEIIFKFQNFINVENSIYSADTKLSDAIDAKVLFASYPQFRDINIVINVSNSNNNNYSGSTYYDIDTNNPYKIEVYADSNENAMRVLIHELQHCIQLKEGFEIGESYYSGEGVMDAIELVSAYGGLKKDDGNYEKYNYENLARDSSKFNGYNIGNLKKFKNVAMNNYGVTLTRKLNKYGDKFLYSINTPIGNVYLDLDYTYRHFTSNTYKEDRFSYAAGFLDTLKNPLFVIRDKHDGEDVAIFYRVFNEPYKTLEGKNKSFSHLVAHSVNNSGEVINKTFYRLDRNSRLGALLNCSEEQVLFYKHSSPAKKQESSSNIERFFNMNIELLRDDIISEKESEVNSNTYKDGVFNKIDDEKFKSYLMNEWEEEGLLSLFEQGYISEEKEHHIKNDFLKYAKEFIKFEKIDLRNIAGGGLYSGNSIAELENNTSYMGKNIGHIDKILNDGSIEPPLFLNRNGSLEILGGRTRSSLCKIKGEYCINAYVIDYDKMKKSFSDLMIKDFIENGYGLFGLADKRDRQKFILDLKYNTFQFDSIKNLAVFADMDNIDIFNNIKNCCEYIYGNKMPKNISKQLSNIDTDLKIIQYSSTKTNFDEVFICEIEKDSFSSERDLIIDMLIKKESAKKVDYGTKKLIEASILGASTKKENAYNILFSSDKIKEAANILGYDGIKTGDFAFSTLEKNDYGLRHIEKIVSIIPNGMSKDGIYKYLELNNVSKEDIKDTSFYNVIENDIFINPIKNTDSINKDSSYWNNKGEIESREIEDKYISLANVIKIDDSIENMSDNEIKDMLTKLAHSEVDVYLV